ncbi:hypothetical protein FE257_005837 [Aspergillus nanangensis]|uniref:Major facilitator superfamily (MFS) profile domain-containing protein n=1 Tax=Aspergillus nanangensis TaxID=2582783 RepID=A0AAD4CRJ6_ASPNN|nr:hypothetical protein FE257_005837 [Aspergillus nanangensis]
MSDEDFKQSIESSHVEHAAQDRQKHGKNGILLVPQPSDNPEDPLNWPTSKKLRVLMIVNLAAFSGTAQALINAAGFHPQAELYGKTLVEMSYSLSAACAGLAVGPLVWAMLSERFGKCACIFWSLLISMALNVWSACMTSPNQYIPFVISRMLSSLFSSAPTCLGSKLIMETFFLHDRGKCFALYSSCILLGTVAASTISGLIVDSQPWPHQFWFCVGLQGGLAVLCLLWVDDTCWPRTPQEPVVPMFPTFVQRKLATYILTNRFLLRQHSRPLRVLAKNQLCILFSPITICVAGALSIYFAWSISINTYLSIYLQEPEKIGGYGFTPLQNALFTFCQWASIVAAQLYGHFVNDRLPLALCARNHGRWKAEYRLHSLWIPVLIIQPIGLGLFGVSLRYHLHYMVLAVATFLATFAAVAGTPSTTNYLVEAFPGEVANDVMAVVNFYRMILGIAVPFFLEHWSEVVSVNWVYGTMAFAAVFACMIVIGVVVTGGWLRSKSLIKSGVEQGVSALSAGMHCRYPVRITYSKDQQVNVDTLSLSRKKELVPLNMRSLRAFQELFV